MNSVKLKKMNSKIGIIGVGVVGKAVASVIPGAILYDKYKKKRDDLFPNIEKLYNEGKTTREISDILKISRNVIKKIFKENLIKPKKVADYTKRKIYQ
jgi:lactate dehydrogenase-like 2-hydroxyacid dehydrogenase